MITDPVTLYIFILPVSLIVGGFIVGFVLERIILGRLKKATAKTKWIGDDLLVKAPRGLTTLIFGFIGIYAAVEVFPFEESVRGLVGKALSVILILLGTVVVSRVAAGLVTMYTSREDGVLPTTSIFVNIARALVLVLGVVIILQALGVSITPILTALGVGGLAVALALQETLSNLFAGIQIILSRKLKPGDYIKLDSGEEGFVEDISWRNTVIRENPNNLIVVPNSKIANVIITNYNMPENEMTISVVCGVSYDSDLGNVEKVTIEEAKKVLIEFEGGVADYEPLVRFNNFGDSSIDFKVLLRINEYRDQFLIKHEFIKRLKKRYEEEGIEIPFPISTVYLEQEEQKA